VSDAPLKSASVTAATEVPWLRSARALADEVNQATYCAGLLVDEGFARWKGGDNGGALECLTKALPQSTGCPPTTQMRTPI
jgi:hypothetical protein